MTVPIVLPDPTAPAAVVIDWPGAPTVGPLLTDDLPLVVVDWSTGTTTLDPLTPVTVPGVSGASVANPPAVVDIAIGVGVPGPAGHDGQGTATPFIFVQNLALGVWEIAHHLGTYPGATVVDSAGRQVYGDVDYPDFDTMIISFGAAFSGVAYLI